LTLKVLHIITGLRRGGAEGVLVRLVCATRPEFDHVVIVLRDEGHFGPVLRDAGIPVHVLDVGGRSNAFAAMARLVRIIRADRPAVVQTWLYHADLLGGIAARLAGTRAVAWGVRNTNLDADAISMPTRLVARVAAWLSGIIPVVIVFNSTESSRVHVDFGYKASRLEVIPNGYDIERLRPDPLQREATRAQLGVRPDELLIGCVARWDPQKDHANLLTALRVIASRRPTLRVMLVGTGMEPQNEQLAALLRTVQMQELTILTGPRDDIPAIMNALDLHVLASLGEAFPNAVAEAMACGTPCVVTDVGDAAYIVSDTGWVAPPRNPQALAAAIEEALVTLERVPRETLSSRCRARIVENFGMRRMTDSYSALWRKLGRRAT
jgi:glycosyltransferase involved in cell wall biosynthesis